MQVFATFDHNPFVEVAISELQTNGFRDIYAVPLDLRKAQPRIIDHMHHADGISFLDLAFVFAFLLSTIGASKGFVWPGGPIIWGLGGAGAGFALGLLVNVGLYLLRLRKYRTIRRKGSTGDIILIVSCEEPQIERVKDILWDHYALAMAVTK